MTTAHLLYIPAVILLGVVIGYKMGLAAMRNELARRRKRGEDL
jgi:hypothetical protein